MSLTQGRPHKYFMQFVFKPADSGNITYCSVRHPFMGKRVRMTLSQWNICANPESGSYAPTVIRTGFTEMESVSLVGQIFAQPPNVQPTISDNGNGGLFLPNIPSPPAQNPNNVMASTSYYGGGKMEFDCNLTWQELTCYLYEDTVPVGDTPHDSVNTSFHYAILGFQVELLE